MLKNISTGILLGVFSLLPIAAWSQSGIFMGPHVGIQKSRDANDPNYLVGATARVKLLPILGAEGDIGYRQEKFGSDAVTVRQWPVTVTGMIYPLPIIYGGIGGGWYHTTSDYSDTYNDAGIKDDTQTKFGWHLVAGLELPASGNFRLYGDVRYVFLNYKFKKLPGAVLDGAKSDFYSINVGMLFRL